MPNPNAFVARVNRVGPTAPAAAPPTAAAVAAPERIAIDFEGDRSAVLPPGRRARVWREMLEFTRASNLPAYVEIDVETTVITRVLIPMRARVVTLTPASENVEVTFVESHARHYLLRANPDFHDMLNALEGGRVDGTEVLVTASRDEHEIIDVRPPPPAEPPVDAYEDPPPSVVSEAQATQLFNDMAALTCDPFTVPSPCIPFLYPDDGCWGRAHEMCRLMINLGLSPKKVWIEHSAGHYLHVSTKNNPNCFVEWNWHVAPTLCVRQGCLFWFWTEQMVIDPSLFTTPVTQATWKSVQGDPGATLTPSAAAIFYLWGNSTDPTYTQTNQVLATYRLQLQNRAINSGPPPYANCP